MPHRAVSQFLGCLAFLQQKALFSDFMCTTLVQFIIALPRIEDRGPGIEDGTPGVRAKICTHTRSENNIQFKSWSFAEHPTPQAGFLEFFIDNFVDNMYRFQPHAPHPLQLVRLFFNSIKEDKSRYKDGRGKVKGTGWQRWYSLSGAAFLNSNSVPD